METPVPKSLFEEFVASSLQRCLKRDPDTDAFL